MNRDEARSLIIGIVGSIVSAALIAVGARTFKSQSTQVLTLGVLTSLSIGALLGVALKIPGRVAGREAFMKRNLRALSAESVALDRKDVTRIDSTRFGEWPAEERSKTRTAFRRALDDAAANGVRLRRIHNLATGHDKTVLLKELETYRNRENVSISMQFSLDVRLLPEILVTSNYASFGPASRPEGVMSSGFFFRRRMHVDLIEAYFEGIWTTSLPLLSHGRLNAENSRWLNEWSPS